MWIRSVIPFIKELKIQYVEHMMWRSKMIKVKLKLETNRKMTLCSIKENMTRYCGERPWKNGSTRMQIDEDREIMNGDEFLWWQYLSRECYILG